LALSDRAFSLDAMEKRRYNGIEGNVFLAERTPVIPAY
jgi:hypothetical protein